MVGLGPYLSRLREERGYSLDEMARATRVARRYLEALERDDFGTLPAVVFTRGYIRAYCQVLEVPSDEALSRYAERVEAPAPVAVAPSAPTRPRPAESRARGTLLVSFLLLVGFGAALIVVALVLQAGRPEVGSRRAESPAVPVQQQAKAVQPEPAPAAPAPIPAPEATSPAASQPEPSAAVPPGPATVSPIRSPAPPAPTTAAPKPPIVRPLESKSVPAVEPTEPPPIRLGGVASPYRLVARTVESTWLRVRTEDGRATEETIPAGEVREWISNRPFVLTIGNAAGVALELNGQKLPPLGARGAVIGRLVLPPAEP